MKTYCTNCGKLSDSKETQCPSCKSLKIPAFRSITEDPSKVCSFLKFIAILTIIGGAILSLIFFIDYDEIGWLGILMLISSLIAAAFTFAASNAVYNIAVASTKCEQIKLYMSILTETAVPNIDETLSEIKLDIKDKE